MRTLVTHDRATLSVQGGSSHRIGTFNADRGFGPEDSVREISADAASGEGEATPF